jgi:dynein heavy chain
MGSVNQLDSNANLLKGSNFDLKKAVPANPTLNKADMLLEKKRASLDARHRYLIEKAAEVFEEKPLTIENALLAGNKLEQVSEFFSEGGVRKVILVWQASSKVLLRLINFTKLINSL